MISTSTTPCSVAASTGSRTSSSSPTTKTGTFETHVLNDEGMNNVVMIQDEDDNTSFNDSNGGEGNSCRSTSASGAGLDSSLAFHREGLACKETRAVTKIKLLVFGSLFCSMVAVVVAAYFLSSQAEQSNFELQFHDDANKILGNMGRNLQRIMEASDAFVTSMTSHAARTNQTWPFVVVPDFTIVAEKIRSLCGAVYVSTYHVVEHEQRKEWENFTATVGREMVDEAIEAIAEYDLMDWPITPNYSVWNVIYDYDEYDKENKVCKEQVMTMYCLSSQHP
jgi:hypothetical protein